MLNIDARLLKQIKELDALRSSRDDHWQIPRVEGDLLYHLALSANAMLIVEIGTSYGFSGLHWAAALRQTRGQLHTIDVSEKKFNSSKATFAAAGVADLVTNYLGDAQAILKGIAGPIDIAFIDADKVSTRAYFDLLWEKIRVGGSVLTDNATTHRDELSDFVKYVRGLANASSVEVAVGNGVEWTIKLR